MNLYKFEKTKDDEINDKDRMKTIRVYKKDEKTQITPSEIKKLVDSLLTESKKTGKKHKIMIRGKCNSGTFTLKGFNTVLRVDESEDYFEGKVRDASHFANFNQLEITIAYQI